MKTEGLKTIYRTRQGEHVLCSPGNRCPGDRKLYISDRTGALCWPHSLELIAACLRAKAHVEDTRYRHGEGKRYLLRFVTAAIMTRDPIKELCRRFKIRERTP
ncbi:MAG: hypothetical protein SWQ30_10035 [Thermodesulfobacteriota bacterium]|nr:hypothetical protein [Thermodesulfobacteriota bacterium]